MEIINNIKNLFLSPRFIAFYWQAGSVSVIGLLNLVSENISSLGLPSWGVVAVGLVIAQITKALSNYSQGKEMGFAKK